MINQDCQCATCRQRADKPLTPEDIAAHQAMVDNFWKDKRIKELEQQRDGLLAALEDLQLCYTTLFNLYAPTHYHPSSNYTSDLDLALAASNAAITKAKS